MAIKRRTVSFSADVAQKVGLGDRYGVIRRVDCVASADTTVAVTIADDDGVNVYTLASGDHTTKKRQYITPIETTVVDTGGDAMIDAEGAPGGVVASGPVTVTPVGIGSGTFTVDIFVEV